MSESYDRFASRYEDIFFERQRHKIETLFNHVPLAPSGPRLDAGCGTGILSRVLMTDFVSLDRSAGMLERAPGSRIRGDMIALPFSDDCFSTVVSVSAVVDSTPMDIALSELHRVLAPGGILAVSILKTEDLTQAEFILNRLFQQAIKRVDLGPDLGFVVEKQSRSL